MQYFTTRSAGGEVNEIAAGNAWMDGNMRDAGKSADFRAEFEDFLNSPLGGGGGSAGQNAASTEDMINIAYLCSNGYNVSTFFYNNGLLTGGIDGQGNKIPILPDIFVTNHVADYAGWGKAMNDRFGQSLGWDFGGYGSDVVGLDPLISHLNSTTTNLLSIDQSQSINYGPFFGNVTITTSGGTITKNSNNNGILQLNTVTQNLNTLGQSIAIGSSSNSLGIGYSFTPGNFTIQPQISILGNSYHINIQPVGDYFLPSFGWGTYKRVSASAAYQGC